MASTHQEAAKEIMRHAAARNGQHPGCYVLSGFVPHAELLRAANLAPPAGLTGKALSEELGRFYQENDGFRFLVDSLLGHIADDVNHGDRVMAARILSQIEADRIVGPIYRKPCHYAAAHEEGLAIAIAIDDRFWTEEWDKDSPENENIQALEGGENVSDYQIGQLLPTDGDWFALQPEYLGKEEGYRYTMERVTCWALIKGEKCIDHLAAVGSRSYPLTDDINEDISFVCGRDKCPTGQTWLEVYDSVPPSRSIGWVELPKEVVAAMHP